MNSRRLKLALFSIFFDSLGKIIFLGIALSASPVYATSCDRALQTPVSAPTLSLKPVDLEESVARTGLTKEHIQIIKKHSKGMIDIYQLMREKRKKDGFLLGLTSRYRIYSAVSVSTGLALWDDAYDRFGIDRMDPKHTDKFMTCITNTQEEIVFLVPNQLWTHPKGVVTKREMYWLLSRPEKMKNVTFVFGAWESVDPKNWDEVFSSQALERPQPFENLSFEKQMTFAIMKALKKHASLYSREP